MSHAVALLICKNENEIEEVLAPYDENKDVDRYKVYLDKQEIKDMAKYYKVKPVDEKRLVEHMDSWRGQEGGLDKKGLYGWSQYNPKSKWDWYEIGGRWAGLVKGKRGAAKFKGRKSWTQGDNNPYLGSMCDGGYVKDINLDHFRENGYAHAVVTKDGWFEGSEMGWFGMSSPHKTVENVPESFSIEKFKEVYTASYYKRPEKKEFKDYIEKYYEKTKDSYVRNKKSFGKRDLKHSFFWFLCNEAWNQSLRTNFLDKLTDKDFVAIIDYHI
jgi:hypothetical protein